MNEFLQTYGSWIIFGLLMLLMFRMHGGGQGGAHSGGHGCGMGPGGHSDHMNQHGDREDSATDPDISARKQPHQTAIEIARAWPCASETSGPYDDQYPSNIPSEEGNCTGGTTADQPPLQADAKHHQHSSCH